MYIEIHPFFHNSLAESNAQLQNQKKPSSEFYEQTDPIVIRLDTIKQIRQEIPFDRSCVFTRLVVSDDYHNDIIISTQEGETIKKKLLQHGNELAKEVNMLTTAVRDLWTLLRNRLH